MKPVHKNGKLFQKNLILDNVNYTVVHFSCISSNLTYDIKTSLDLGALINIDTPGCGTSVVRGPMGTSRKVLILGYSCTQRFLR